MPRILIFLMTITLFLAGNALAHFGMVIPSQSTVNESKNSEVLLQLSFSHPMEMVGMPLAKPKSFKVMDADGQVMDLSGSVEPTKIMENEAWQATYKVSKPGVYQFFMEPEPYWEPAEDSYIIHYTKTIVGAFGDEDGWNKKTGARVEIIPLSRPFANYAGNVFQGQVLMDGKPAAGVPVEVEYYNKDKKYRAANEYMVTQTVMTDERGIFTYGVPFVGWWGFAALVSAPEKMDYQGQPKDVELGGVLWVNYLSPSRAK